jgi:hypothetical protein
VPARWHRSAHRRRGRSSPPGLLGQRLDETIEDLVDDVRQWNIEARSEEAERELLRSLQGAVQKVVQRTADKLPAADDDNQ